MARSLPCSTVPLDNTQSFTSLNDSSISIDNNALTVTSTYRQPKLLTTTPISADQSWDVVGSLMNFESIDEREFCFGPDSTAIAELDGIPWYNSVEKDDVGFCFSEGYQLQTLSLADRNCQPSSTLHCEICLSTFPTGESLELHAKKTLHKTYACPEGCGKRYYRRDSLARHKQVCLQKGNFKHACQLCLKSGIDKAFGRKDHLQQHMKNLHQHDKTRSNLNQRQGTIPIARQLEYIPSTTHNKSHTGKIEQLMANLREELGDDPIANDELQRLQRMLSMRGKLLGRQNLLQKPAVIDGVRNAKTISRR